MSSSKSKTLAMMPWFPRDYLAATRHMTLAERGAYTDLLFFSWDSGRPLPKDPARLAALINCTPKVFSTIWPSLREKFIETEAGYINERLEAERRRSLDMREKASEKASAAAKAMWEKKRPGDAPSSARSTAPSIPKPVQSMLGSLLEQCPPTPSPSPSPSSSSEVGNDAGSVLTSNLTSGPARRLLVPSLKLRAEGNGGAKIDEQDPEVRKRRQQAKQLAAMGKP